MRLIVTMLAVTLAASTTFAGPPGKALPEGYAWETSYEQARLKAAESGKLLYIDFYTDW